MTNDIPTEWLLRDRASQRPLHPPPVILYVFNQAQSVNQWVKAYILSVITQSLLDLWTLASGAGFAFAKVAAMAAAAAIYKALTLRAIHSHQAES